MNPRQRLPQAWLILWLGASVLARLLSDESHDLPRVLGAPEPGHWLGFDAFGRDILLATLRASATSTAFAGIVVVTSLGLGLIAGLGLALSGRRVSALGAGLLEALLAFPSLLLALGWAAARGPGWSTLLISLAIGTLPAFTRLIQVRSREIRLDGFVAAAEALGASPPRVAIKHMLPQLLSLCAIKAPNLFAQALLAEATLSFLGVGAPIGSESWGGLLAQGRDYLIEAPNLALASGFPLVLTILSLQGLSSEAEKSLKRSRS